MSSSSPPLWSSVDRATQPANSSRNHGTAHGFPVIFAADRRTVTVANTDTIAATTTKPTSQFYPLAVTFTVLDPDV